MCTKCQIALGHFSQKGGKIPFHCFPNSNSRFSTVADETTDVQLEYIHIVMLPVASMVFYRAQIKQNMRQKT